MSQDMPKGLERFELFATNESPVPGVSAADAAETAGNLEDSAVIAAMAIRYPVRHCERVRGDSKRQLVAFARIRTIAVCLLCVLGSSSTVEAARTGQSTTAKIQAHPSYPQVNTELTKSSGPKGKMSLGHRVLPKNDLHWGLRRGTRHFPAGAAHRCLAGPRPPITLVCARCGRSGKCQSTGP